MDSASASYKANIPGVVDVIVYTGAADQATMLHSRWFSELHLSAAVYDLLAKLLLMQEHGDLSQFDSCTKPGKHRLTSPPINCPSQAGP